MRTLLVALATLLLVAGCAGAGPAPTVPPSGAPSDPGGAAPSGPLDPSGDWRLDGGTVDGTPIAIDAQHPVTFIVNGTQVGGTSACNQYGGEIVVVAGEVRFSQLSATMMGCEEPVMALESVFTAAMGRIRQASMDGEALVLAGDGVSLRFVPIPPIPTAELVDTPWVLETLLQGEVAASVAGEPGTLLLRRDGTFEGSTGCRTFSGRYQEVGGEIVATDMAMDDRACPAALADQDGHVVSVLGDGFTASIEEGRLTLTSAGGLGLVYAAGE